MRQLFTQHPHDIGGEVFAVRVGAIRDAFHPHRAGEEIRAGQCDLHRPVGERLHVVKLPHRNRLAAPERAEHCRVAHITGRHIERAQFTLELFRIIDQRQQVGQWNQLAVVENAADEARVTVAALLAVRHHVDTGAQLRVDRELHRVVGGGLKRSVVEAAFHMLVDRLHHPARARPTADAHHRERLDRRGGRW